VFISRQDPINDSDVRGAQVRDYVVQVLGQTGKEKVILIGHSQGGFDVRYAASQLPDRVAAVVTVASPMLGDPLADLAESSGPVADQAINILLDLYGAANGFTSNAQAQIAMISAAGALAFFARHPDDPRVDYYSIAGRSDGAHDGPDCMPTTEAPPPFIAKWNDQVDQVNPLLGAAAALLDAQNPKPVHDGVVPVRSARHGVFLGCIPADHLDEVNQLLGDAPGPGNAFDPIRFWRDLADWLVARGY
jgi:triacylglycerol lipase